MNNDDKSTNRRSVFPPFVSVCTRKYRDLFDIIVIIVNAPFYTANIDILSLPFNEKKKKKTMRMDTLQSVVSSQIECFQFDKTIVKFIRCWLVWLCFAMMLSIRVRVHDENSQTKSNSLLYKSVRHHFDFIPYIHIWLVFSGIVCRYHLKENTIVNVDSTYEIEYAP